MESMMLVNPMTTSSHHLPKKPAVSPRMMPIMVFMDLADQPHGQGYLGAVDDPGEDVPALLVGPEPGT